MERPIVRIPARSDKNHTTSVAGGLTVTRRPETVAGTSSVMSMEQVTLEAHSLFGLAYATEELLIDSPQSFIAILEEGFKEQFVYQLVNERLTGTGVGEYMGVLNAPCLITVTKETGQATKTIVYENVLKMRAQCWGYSRAIWLANYDTIPQLMLLNQSVGTGGMPIWVPAIGGAKDDVPDRLLGRPIFFTEYAQTLGTAGDLICGNWSQYLEGTLEPMKSAESIHVRFVNHERAFKFWTRNAGQPWWRVAITPKYSTSTLSPFVVLGAR
jgi:HK97 family phage major capsid protein